MKSFRLQSGLGPPQAAWGLESVLGHALCVSCLILQRFGATLSSGSQLPVSLVVAPLIFLALSLTGRVRVSAITSLLLIVFLISALTTCFLTILYPDFAFRFSLLSFFELIVLYSLAALRPAGLFNPTNILPIFIFWARIIAVFGIVQYGLQFAHIRLFSFRDLHIPSAILLESTYHTVAPLAYGSSILRSNGFFLLEPSILSQVMALACIVDGFVRKRYMFLPLYLVAILASFSGTGILVLVAASILNGLLSPRQLPRVVILLIGAGVAAVAFAFVFPEQFATLASRANPNDPSAQARYVEQVRILDTIRSDPRLLLGFGPGAADGFVQLGSLSAASKLLFDYGALGAILFGIMLVSAWWRPDAVVLTLGALLTYQFGGGYLLFPSLVILLILICAWSQKPAVVRLQARAGWAPWARKDERLAV